MNLATFLNMVCECQKEPVPWFQEPFYVASGRPVSLSLSLCRSLSLYPLPPHTHTHKKTSVICTSGPAVFTTTILCSCYLRIDFDPSTHIVEVH
jgi:hypothetical protein